MKKPSKGNEGNMRLLGHMTALSEGAMAEGSNQATKRPPPQQHQENSNSTPRNTKIQLRK